MSTIEFGSSSLGSSPPEEPLSAATAKKPYEKPGFRFDQVFVVTALTCGKVGTAGQCGQNPNAS
jgi:hypothetical protein